MRLKNENFRNMEINLRSGARVRADDEGCIEVENEADAQFMLTHGFKAVARSPRSLSGTAVGAPDGALWPGGPTKKDVEDLRLFANEMQDALHDAQNDIQVRDAKIAKLEAEVADLKARLGSQALASGPETVETVESTSEVSEGASGAPKAASGRRLKAPKPE
jgi:hypothetical protein